MKITRNLLLSGKTLASRKGRTALTLLGMAIGVAVVIVMVAVGSGAEREVLERISAMGTNMLVVSAGKMKTMVGRSQETNLHTSLTLRDCQAIRDECPTVALAAPAQDQVLKIKAGELATMAQVLGSTPGILCHPQLSTDKRGGVSPPPRTRPSSGWRSSAAP